MYFFFVSSRTSKSLFSYWKNYKKNYLNLFSNSRQKGTSMSADFFCEFYIYIYSFVNSLKYCFFFRFIPCRTINLYFSYWQNGKTKYLNAFSTYWVNDTPVWDILHVILQLLSYLTFLHFKEESALKLNKWEMYNVYIYILIIPISL